MRLKPIGEQVVVVMGASSGIGRAAALRFAARGARLVVAARGAEGLDSLVALIRANGGVATAVVADTSDFAQVKRVADTAADLYGRIDTWVQTAGTSVIARFEETTPDEFRRVIDVNLTGQALGAMAALPYLRQEGRGALVHVSSVEARISMPYQSAYAASKHGVEGFLDSLRIELASDGVPIGVTNIMPGPVNTPFFDTVRTKIGFKPTVPPPIYDSYAVADAIVRAAEHPARHVIVGGMVAAGVALQAVAPHAMDAILTRIGFVVQRSREPKAAGGPDSLFAPMAGFDTTHGSIASFSRRKSRFAALHGRPAARRAVWAAIAGSVAAGLAIRRMRASND
jgi:NAD(P)-dependent dehydrogenase (short-subunit alcohol dehydrogenase family)